MLMELIIVIDLAKRLNGIIYSNWVQKEVKLDSGRSRGGYWGLFDFISTTFLQGSQRGMKWGSFHTVWFAGIFSYIRRDSSVRLWLRVVSNILLSKKQYRKQLGMHRNVVIVKLKLVTVVQNPTSFLGFHAHYWKVT